MNKGELTELVYGKNYTAIDTGIPQPLWKKVNKDIHVMNYNNHGVYGRLDNMVQLAMAGKKKLPQEILDAEYQKCLASDEYFYNNYCKTDGMPWYTPEVFAKYQRTVTVIREVQVKPYFNKD